MTSKRIAQTNQQQKSETSQASGILQRTAVRSVADAGVQFEEQEALALSNSAFSKDFSRVPISTTQPQPIQAKLTIGEPGDKYEQEADRVASQVVQQINIPSAAQSTQGKSLQRQDAKEEEIQTKPSISVLQRSPLPTQVQLEAMPEDEKLQAKSILQGRDARGAGEASTGVESAINSARGGGMPLDAGLQRSMGQAMGADFSGVKVHTDAQADQLNQSIQAKAFTTGQDVFFRQGEYNLGSRSGQELIAHELTHVVQQNGGQLSLQRKEILNLASGTKIENLMKAKEKGDNVINLDRGDMMDIQFILNHYDKFKSEIDQEFPENSDELKFKQIAKNRLKTNDDLDERIPEQIKKEKVRSWFYDIMSGNIEKLEKIINDKGLGNLLNQKKSNLLESNNGFKFGNISPEMKFKNECFDEIHMVSGHNIPILKEEAYTKEMARLLKPNGVLIITGNKAVLNSNGIKFNEINTVKYKDFLEEYFLSKPTIEELKAKEVGSEHTLGGKFNDEEVFYKFTFKKKSISGIVMGTNSVEEGSNAIL